jgi:hypothetical protein
MTLSQINRTFFSAALAALLFANGCDTSEDGPIDATPHPAFSATINGEAWSSSGPEPVDERIHADPEIDASKLRIEAFRTVNGKTDVLTLRLSSPQEGINILKPSQDQQGQTASFIPGNIQDSMFYMTTADSGQVILDHYDATTTRISGSFWFTATNKSQPLAVTSGTFKDVLIRK